MTTRCESIDYRVEFSEQQRSAVNGQPPVLAFIVLIISLLTPSLWAEVPGRVTYRDGSPCAFCWLTIELQDRSFKMRADGDGYFELEIETSEQIKRMRARNLRGERIVEDGFLFLFLHRDNPQLEPVIKDLRKRLQTYRVFTSSTLVQQLISEDCYFIVEREVSLFDRVSRFRSVEVDLSKLELLEACNEDTQACIRLQPARVLGEKNRLDMGGAVVFFDGRHKEQVPGLLHSIALLARACGNLKTHVMAPKAPCPPEKLHPTGEEARGRTAGGRFE